MNQAQIAVFHVLSVLFFVVVLGESAIAKVFARETPSWFVDKFRDTWLGRLGPPASLQWWAITLAELAVVAVLLAALVQREFLDGVPNTLTGYGLLGAAAVFIALNFGLRVASDFVGATHALIHGVAALVLWYLIYFLPTSSW